MLLHVLLKPRIHFSLCKYKNLQFGHESSVPISFKHTFIFPGRVELLTWCLLSGWSPSTTDSSQAVCKPGRWLRLMLGVLSAWAKDIVGGLLQWRLFEAWSCSSKPFSSMCLLFSMGSVSCWLQSSSWGCSAGGPVPRDFRGGPYFQLSSAARTDTDGLALLSHANLPVQRLHSCLGNHWGLTVQSTATSNTVFSH